MTDRFVTTLPPHVSWLARKPHTLWLAEQGRRLVDFSKASRMDLGFGPLDENGTLTPDATPDSTLTARMTHAYAMAALQGLPGCLPLAQHGVNALRGGLRDHRHGGWTSGPSEPDGRKQAYLHAFVALAASSATLARLDGADELLKDATDILDRHFWSEEEGVMRESFAADWSDEEDYRGANSNMHSTEMCMAMADVTHDPKWRHRALKIVTRFVHTLASQHDFAMPEHFNRRWELLKDYNRDKPTHSLRPYGMTPGHFVEWSHLTLKLEAALLQHEGTAPDWMLHDARALFNTGMKTGWHTDQTPGLIYTIDWDHKPHTTVRAHWAQAEALTAAFSLLKRTGATEYETWYRKIWDYIDQYCIDRKAGSWFNELAPDGTVSSEIYPGKADLYHAYQSTLSPALPLSPSMASAIVEIGVPY